jgi:hypothetical protein
VTTDNPIFGLAVSNLPIINIREEFETCMQLLSDDAFAQQL